MPKHILSDINLDTREATCSVCGPTVAIGKGKGKWQCATVRRAGTKGRHGVSHADVIRLRAGELCAICGASEDLALDHDHKTGALRGWLCRACNTGIGNLRDSPDLLAKAIEYLANPPGVVIEDASKAS